MAPEGIKQDGGSVTISAVPARAVPSGRREPQPSEIVVRLQRSLKQALAALEDVRVYLERTEREK